jgi:hypothetical protein
MAGCGPSNLAAGTDDEVGPAARGLGIPPTGMGTGIATGKEAGGGTRGGVARVATSVFRLALNHLPQQADPYVTGAHDPRQEGDREGRLRWCVIASR